MKKKNWVEWVVSTRRTPGEPHQALLGEDRLVSGEVLLGVDHLVRQDGRQDPSCGSGNILYIGYLHPLSITSV